MCAPFCISPTVQKQNKDKIYAETIETLETPNIHSQYFQRANILLNQITNSYNFLYLFYKYSRSIEFFFALRSRGRGFHECSDVFVSFISSSRAISGFLLPKAAMAVCMA